MAHDRRRTNEKGGGHEAMSERCAICKYSVYWMVFRWSGQCTRIYSSMKHLLEMRARKRIHVLSTMRRKNS